MRRTKEDAQHTRETLLDATELLFAQRGVSRTSLQEIAKAAGMTRGAVYWHFKDKAELFNAMMARTASPMEEAAQALVNSPLPPLAELKRTALDALNRIAHDPRTRRVFGIATQKVEYVDDLMGVRERHLEIHQTCQHCVKMAFERAQALGDVSAHLNPQVIAMSYQALLNGLINHWMLAPEAFDLVQCGEQSLDLFMSGLRQHPTPSSN
ncbi:MAG: TetR family transcriptional regulator [Aquabacterium sp.]|nr:TetR family transcriptional regulator [Aquabacterium sp.]